MGTDFPTGRENRRQIATPRLLPPELWAKVEYKAYLEGKTCGQVIKEILSYYFDWLDVGE